MDVKDMIRELSGIYSQEKIGIIAGISQASICRIVNGKQSVRYDVGKRIEDAYKAYIEGNTMPQTSTNE